MTPPTLKTAIVCSRLGLDFKRIARVTQWIGRAVADVCNQQGTVIVGLGTAAEPLVSHAADLFGAPVVEVTAGQNTDRDVFAAADRVVVAHCRKNGRIASLAGEAIDRGILVKVVVSEDKDGSAEQLIHRGAVGWFSGQTLTRDQGPAGWRAVTIRPGRLLPEGEWLVHCTRACPGPWPGQSLRQYRDELMLAKSQVIERGPEAVLRRIVRSGRLVGGAVASRGDQPVVCFSAVDLGELLRRRTYRSHLKRWDYLPFGIAVRRSGAADAGLREVSYVTGKPADGEPWWRVSSGPSGQWRAEREWRGAGDLLLDRLATRDVCLFVPDQQAATELQNHAGRRDWRVVGVGEQT